MKNVESVRIMKVKLRNVPVCTNEHWPCGLNVLHSALAHYDYDTVRVFFDEWKFYFSVTHGTNSPESSHFKIDVARRSHIQSLERLGIKAITTTSTDFESGWTAVRSDLLNNHPLTVSLNTYFLTEHYYPGRPRHGLHAVILAGFNDYKNTVYIVDPSPRMAYEGTLPFSIFKSSWGRLPNRKANYTWRKLVVPEIARCNDSETIIKNLEDNLNVMRNATKNGIGISAVKQLSDFLGEQKTRTTKLLDHCYSAFKLVATYRSGHVSYLSYAGKVLNNNNLLEISSDLRLSAQSWRVCSNIALKSIVKSDYDMITRIARRINQIHDMEKKAIDKLSDTLCNEIPS